MNGFLNVFNKKKQYTENLPVNKMNSSIEKWSAMYENRYSDTDSEKSLNLAAAICSELARLTTIEFKTSLTGSNRADFLNLQYQRIVDKARVFTEYACAKGGVVLKPYLEKGQIFVGVIQADAFYPTSFSQDGEITGAVFYETHYMDGYYFTRCEEHGFFGDVYVIKNTAYKSKSADERGDEVSLTAVRQWADLEPVCRIENIKRPLFVYFKMPAANTKNCESPLGVSAFARAVDLIKDANKQYSDLLWEYESGKRALFLDECAIRRNEDGSSSLPQKRLYRMLSTGDDTLFKDWSPEMRDINLLHGLDRILRSIEFNCGLAYGTLSDLQSVEKTAEEIKASKQRSYATVCDIQKALQKALEELILTMDIYCDIYSLAPKGEILKSFEFDDSIVCDRTAEFSEKLTLLEKGVIKPWEFRMWYFNEDEETAHKKSGENN